MVDPELPMLTLADLGVLRGVELSEGVVIVTITPTYAGCPALTAMRDDLTRRLTQGGFSKVEIRHQLTPAWSSDDITERGRSRLREHGLSAPGPAPRQAGPIPLTLGPSRRTTRCPRCGEPGELTSEFGPTACTALYVCGSCHEPFEHLKEH
ncbi:MAG: 1,2-phenylacetyl-CoA epoxidase subunit PaaD [Nocardioides sp.]